MKETTQDVNIKETYSSEMLEEYTFTAGKGNKTTNVIVKLDIKPEDGVSNEKIAEGLVQYLSVFEEIMAWQSSNDSAIIRLNGDK